MVDGMVFELEEQPTQNARMKVLGVGGGGGNAVNRMIEEALAGVQFISVNTDAQALGNSRSDVKVQIGKKLTRGLGAGARPEIGRQAIEENRDEVLEHLQGADLVFVTCGMGGGTGTGAAPIIAQMAKDIGALTVGIVTKPFLFEGRKRMKQAEMGITELRRNVDTMIVVPNERLLAVVGKGIPFQDALKKADEVLLNATRGIASLITSAGIINVDFADVRTVMQNGGAALMGTGIGSGREPGAGGGTAGDLVAIARQCVDQRRQRGADQHSRRRRPDPRRGDPDQRDHPRCGGRRCPDHLRCGQRFEAQRRGAGHRDRHRLRPGGHRRAGRGARCTGAGPAVPAPARHPATDPAGRGCNPPGAPGIPPAAAVRAAGPRGPSATGRLARRVRHGNPDLHPAADGLMSRRIPRFPFALAILGAAALFAIRGQWPWPRLTEVPTALPIVVTDPFRVVSDTLHSGESISTLLARQGVSGFDFDALADLLHFDPRRLRAGLVFSVHREVITDEPTRIELRPDDSQRLRFIRTAGGDWSGVSLPIHWTTDTIRVSGVIESSLTEAADRAISEATFDADARAQFVNELADVFAWSVDFSRDPQPGDPFSAVVERQVSEDGEVRFGRVLAGDATIGGHDLTAIRYTPASSGKAGYYDASGKALRREFLAAPLQFRYITSGVTGRRFHPVLKTWRRHEGIDYSAATGTPVHATANGVVTRAGFNGGYGRMVEVRHRNGIVTRYAHLSAITAGIRPGRSVAQGDQVGRVGSTGLATAPHLHYEFRVNGVARDPRSMKFEAGEPLAKGDFGGFRAERDRLLAMLGLDRGDAAGTLLTD